MMRRVLLVLFVLSLSSPVMAAELVTNGDFESDPAPAWTKETAGASATVDRATTYHSDPDYEVGAQKLTGNGHAKASQTVVIPSTDVGFSVSAKMQVYASAGGPWAAAGVALHYEDYLGDVLGTTVIARTTALCPWVDSDTFHLIPAPDELWNDYSFNVGTELANLSGVDMMAVHQIRISIFGQVGGDC